MKQRYEIADLKNGNNIYVTATAEDGSLTIFDLSYGPAADLCFGEDADVEVWLELSPEAVREFSVHLFGKLVGNPANETAQHLAATYQSDSRALRKIQETLDQQGIQYEKKMWA